MTTTKHKPVAEHHFYVNDPTDGATVFLVAVAMAVERPVRGSYNEPASGGYVEDVSVYRTDGEEGPIVGDALDAVELARLKVPMDAVEDFLYQEVCERDSDGCDYDNCHGDR